MIDRSVVMSFKDEVGKSVSIKVKDVKEDVEDSDIKNLMDLFINTKLIKSDGLDLAEKVSAQVVLVETTKVEL